MTNRSARTTICFVFEGALKIRSLSLFISVSHDIREKLFTTYILCIVFIGISFVELNFNKIIRQKKKMNSEDKVRHHC